MLQDLRSACRFLWRRPAATLAALLTLGLGLSACTLAAALLDHAFERPLDAFGAAQLFTIYNSRPAAPQFQVLSYPDYSDVRDRLAGDVDLAAFVRIDATATTAAGAVREWGELVSGNYFDVLAARAAIGRRLAPGDDKASADGVPIVISDDLWRRSFGGDPGALGAPFRLGHVTATIVGVMPPRFHGPAYPSNFWMPLSATPAMIAPGLLARADIPLFQTIARAASGGTAVRARVAALSTSASAHGWTLNAYPGAYLRFWPAYRATVLRFLGGFAALAICVMIIASANLAGLLAMRAHERQRELAVRQALGASPLQLARRLAAEGLVLAVLGSALSSLLVCWAVPLFARVPLPVPVRLGLTLDARLAVIGLLIAFAASIAFMALPALPVFRGSVESILRASSGTMTRGLLTQRAIVAFEIALTGIVLTLAGLLARSAWSVERIDVGFEPVHQLAAFVEVRDRVGSDADGVRFFERLQDRLERSRRFQSVALGQHLPLGSIRATDTFTVDGTETPLSSRYDVVSARYFSTLGIPLLRGRDFEPRDRDGGEPVAIVNEALAHRMGGIAVGRLIRRGRTQAAARIVGVVGEIKYNGITEPSQPFVYLPLAQVFRSDLYVFVRTADPGAAGAIRDAVAALDPQIAVSDIRAMSDQAAQAREVPRVSALLSAGAAAVALFLATVGLYGVLMTSVDVRAREMAIRAALGATRADIVGRILTEGAVLLGLGLLAGVLGSVAAAPLVAAMLYGVDTHDTLVFAVVPAVLTVISAAAWLTPARRAAAIDPALLLRAQ